MLDKLAMLFINRDSIKWVYENLLGVSNPTEVQITEAVLACEVLGAAAVAGTIATLIKQRSEQLAEQESQNRYA